MSGRRRNVQTPARPPDWLPRLEAAIARGRGLSFLWGRHDCCLFPCDAVRAMTGVDLARGWRGRYHSLRRAMILLHGAGGLEALAEAIAQRHRLAEIPPATAHRGDVVLVDGRDAQGVARFDPGPGGPVCLAIVGLNGADALAVAPAGLLEVPMPFWRRAWRIE